MQNDDPTTASPTTTTATIELDGAGPVEVVLTTQKQAEKNALGGDEVHIRVQQRKGRKSVTTVQGLDPNLNFNRINREFQRRWGCNGTVITTTNAGTVIQLQGNWSENIKQFLLDEHMVTEANLRIHAL